MILWDENDIEVAEYFARNLLTISINLQVVAPVPKYNEAKIILCLALLKLFCKGGNKQY